MMPAGKRKRGRSSTLFALTFISIQVLRREKGGTCNIPSMTRGKKEIPPSRKGGASRLQILPSKGGTQEKSDFNHMVQKEGGGGKVENFPGVKKVDFLIYLHLPELKSLGEETSPASLIHRMREGKRKGEGLHSRPCRGRNSAPNVIFST